MGYVRVICRSAVLVLCCVGSGAFQVSLPLLRPHVARFPGSQFPSRTTGQADNVCVGMAKWGEDLAPKSSRRKNVSRRFRRFLASAILGASVALNRAGPAQAKMSYELRDLPGQSLRPGMSRDQANLVEKGEMDASEYEGKSIFDSSAPPVTPEKTAAKAKSDFVYGEDDDLDFDDDELNDSDDSLGPASHADQHIASEVAAAKKDKFASYGKGKTKAQTITVTLAICVPGFGGQVLREYYRRRKEEEYVKKGLEVVAAQRAEYFNVTNTKSDSDVEDELKDLKNKDEDDDDSEDDDEDDDEEDDDEDTEDDDRRPGRGGPPSGGDDGEGGGGGESGPSEADIDRLNQMFGKS